MKKLIIVLIAFLFACGGMAEGEYQSADAGPEIGEGDQALISQVASVSCGRFTGVRIEQFGLSHTGGTCPSSPNNEYFVPRVKNLTFRTVNNSCSQAEHTAMTSKLDGILAAYNTDLGPFGWSFSRSSTGTHTVRCDHVTDVGSESIRSYVRTQCTKDPSVLIVSSEVAAKLFHYSTCTITIDVHDAFVRGTSSAEDDRILTHAETHGLGKLLGVGEYSLGTSRMFGSDIAISPTVPGRITFSPGELCRTRNYATTQIHNYFLDFNAGCADW